MEWYNGVELFFALWGISAFFRWLETFIRVLYRMHTKAKEESTIGESIIPGINEGSMNNE